MKKSIPNSPVTRTLQEGILMDVTGHMPLTVWGNYISKIIENRWYQITDEVIRKYHCTKLLTTPISIFEEIGKESTRDWSGVDIANYLNHEKVEKEKLLKEITLPKIMNVSLSTNSICTNKSCRNKVKVTAGENIAKCISCNRKMLVKVCIDGFEGYIDVKSEDDQVVTLQTDSQVLLNYFDIKKGDTNLDELEDKLLELEDFSIAYNIASSKIVSITSAGSG